MPRNRPIPPGAGGSRPRRSRSAAPAAPTPEESRRALEEFRRTTIERNAENRARRMAQMDAIRNRRKLGKGLKYGGIAALGALGLAAAVKKGMRTAGVLDEQLMEKAASDLQAQMRQAGVNDLTSQAQSMSYEDAIGRNLQQIQRYAPDLYMSVAAGRRLPTGAVVLGGSPRQDLLNELGRAMSDGQFSR